MLCEDFLVLLLQQLVFFLTDQHVLADIVVLQLAHQRVLLDLELLCHEQFLVSIALLLLKPLIIHLYPLNQLNLLFFLVLKLLFQLLILPLLLLQFLLHLPNQCLLLLYLNYLRLLGFELRGQLTYLDRVRLRLL